jgi:cyclin-dependent kinase
MLSILSSPSCSVGAVTLAPALTPLQRPPPRRLLCVEHVEENGKPCLYLVFEYLTTDMKKWMDRNGRGPAYPLDPAMVKSMMYQLLKGVAHMHKLGVMHRDLKPQNMLVDESKEHPLLKTADLGLGRHFSVPIKSYTHEIVTLWYRAPEVLLGCTHYAPAVDMWSVGCMFAELVRKVSRGLDSHTSFLFPPPLSLFKPKLTFALMLPNATAHIPCLQQAIFPGDSELQQLLHVFKLLGTPTEEMWPGVTELKDWHEFPQWKPQDLSKVFPKLEPSGIDLMQKLLAYDPAARLNAKDAVRHPYFDDLDKAMIDAMEAESLRNAMDE